MSTTDRPDASATPAGDLAAGLDSAGFVRLVAAPTGAAVAAAGLLAGAVDAYQVTVAPTGDADAATRATEADCTVGLGLAAGDQAVHERASTVAYEAAKRLGADPNPWLALAGQVAAGAAPSEPPLEAAAPDRRPGLAVPTADPVEGLVHTTLAAGPFGTDRAAAEHLLADANGDDETARRRRSSLVALAVAEHATPRGADRVERLLRPHVGGPFGTVEGYADVLDAAARTRPGLAAAVAVGAGDRDLALDAWRAHGRRAHETLAEADTTRYDGLVVVRAAGAPLGTVARLVADYRSPEPVALAVGEDRAALFTTDDTDARRVADAAVDAAGAADGTAREARLTTGKDRDPAALTAAVREAL